MPYGFAEGQLIAYVGADDLEHDLFEGQPGVVISIGPSEFDIDVSLASGPSLSIPPWMLAEIHLTDYRERADRMKRHRHPLREEPITLREIFDGIQDPIRPDEDA